MILIQCMCFALNLNKMFSISYFFDKFIVYKKIIIGYKEPTTIVAPSTACLLLSRGGCHILLIFYCTLVANFVSIWFILTRFIFSHYLIVMVLHQVPMVVPPVVKIKLSSWLYQYEETFSA